MSLRIKRGSQVLGPPNQANDQDDVSQCRDRVSQNRQIKGRGSQNQIDKKQDIADGQQDKADAAEKEQARAARGESAEQENGAHPAGQPTQNVNDLSNHSSFSLAPFTSARAVSPT
jgi:hypothetical protein